MSAVLNLNAHSFIEQAVNTVRYAKQLHHHVCDHWPVDPVVSIEATMSSRTADSYEALIERDGCAASVSIDGGVVAVSAYGRTPEQAEALLEALREEIPRAEDSDPDLVPVTFWTYSAHGPQSIRRQIDAPAFDSIEANYPAAGELLSLIHDWTPGAGGQLLLWHGDAGTGKTTALRSLGREWREWAELHYIVDPDRFFGDSASYMMQVMMGEDAERGAPVEFDDGVARRSGERPMWRVLVLEDCAEMLAPDARREVGQALSRLLNACDGLIGRGLRLLILITTNEPLEKVHPAISRPGRCAARIEFERFAAWQASEWLAAHRVTASAQSGLTLADLYALRDGHRSENGRRPVGFAV